MKCYCITHISKKIGKIPSLMETNISFPTNYLKEQHTKTEDIGLDREEAL